MPDMPELAPLAVSARQLAGMLDLSVRTIRTMDAAGKLPRGVRIGRSVRWPVDELRDWLDAGCPDRASWQAIRRNGGGRHHDKQTRRPGSIVPDQIKRNERYS